MTQFSFGMLDPENLPEGMPEELKQRIREHHEMHLRQREMVRMQRDQLESIWDELSLDHLMVIRRLLSGLSDDSGPFLANYYEGIARTHVKFRFGVCGDCGQDHKEAEALGIDPHTLAPVQEKNVVTDADEFLRSMTENADSAEQGSEQAEEGGGAPVEKPVTPDASAPWRIELTPTQLAQMAEYNIDDTYNQDTKEFMYFACLNCGMQYPSIEDRMLKPPGVEGCSGCQQKAKWG